jgi:chromosome partitioning protein
MVEESSSVRVWSVLGQKGGTGKTTLVIHLAIAAGVGTRGGKPREVCVVDLDPQRSAEQFADFRERKAGAEEPAIVHGQAGNLGDMLDAARKTAADLVIVDTPPQIDKTMIFAAAAADLIIVPTRASMLDEMALRETLALLEAARANHKAVIVLNAQPSGRSEKSMEKVVKRTAADFGVPVVDVALPDHADYRRALEAGLGVTESAPRGAAARRILALYVWLCRHELKLSKRKERVRA